MGVLKSAVISAVCSELERFAREEKREAKTRCCPDAASGSLDYFMIFERLFIILFYFYYFYRYTKSSFLILTKDRIKCWIPEPKQHIFLC